MKFKSTICIYLSYYKSNDKLLKIIEVRLTTSNKIKIKNATTYATNIFSQYIAIRITHNSFNNVTNIIH